MDENQSHFRSKVWGQYDFGKFYFYFYARLEQIQ